MRMFLFAKRTWKEIVRDPLSYVFSLLLPVVLMTVLYLAFYSEYTPWFALDQMAPGITVFAGAFVMLSVSLVVSKDRSSSFLVRLYTSPMRTVDFVLGYFAPSVLLGILQSLICYLAADVLLLCNGEPILPVWGTLKAVLLGIPVMMLFVFVGILFGSVFSENAAPGVTSGFVTAVGFLSAAWMPLEEGSGFETVCKALPFYPSVLLAREAMAGKPVSGFYLLQVTGYLLCVFALSVFLFQKQQKKD